MLLAGFLAKLSPGDLLHNYWLTSLHLLQHSIALTGGGVHHIQSLLWKRIVFEEICSDPVCKKFSGMGERPSKSVQRREQR